MLAALGQETSTTQWKGEYFFALRGQRDGETDFSFRARGNGITFTILREGMDCFAKAVPSRMADARGATRVGCTDSRIRRALSSAGSLRERLRPTPCDFWAPA